MAAPKAPKKETGTAVAPAKEAGALTAYDYGGDAGKGMEGVNSSDIIIAAIMLLQGLSPQVAKPVGQGGVDGAKAGAFMNGVSQEMIDGAKGFRFIPVMLDTDHVKWVPRDDGGGIVGRFRPEDPYVAQTIKFNGGTTVGKLKTEDDHELVETKYMYGPLVNDDGTLGETVVLRFTSMKIPAYKAYLTALSNFRLNRKINCPLWAVPIHVTAAFQSNKKGDFYNVDLKPAGEGSGEARFMAALLKPDDERMGYLSGLYEQISKARDAIKIVGDEGRQAGTGDADIPF